MILKRVGHIENRQLELILYLNQKRKTTLSELSERFEVSKRTVMRDLDAISAVGVPVYARQGCKGGVYLDENYQFDQSFFTSQEISDLVLALHVAAQLVRGNQKNTILKKLELLLPVLFPHLSVSVFLAAPIADFIAMAAAILFSTNRGKQKP